MSWVSGQGIGLGPSCGFFPVLRVYYYSGNPMPMVSIASRPLSQTDMVVGPLRLHCGSSAMVAMKDLESALWAMEAMDVDLGVFKKN